MPALGCAGTITPGCAPSTPASNDPSVDTGLPFSYSVVASPRYQTFPHRSWAYQSSVTSIGSPSSVATSWTTRALTPFAITLVFRSTVTTPCCLVPSGAVSRYTHLARTLMGHQRLVIRVLKSDGSRRTSSVLRGMTHCASAVPGLAPAAEATVTPRAAA